MLDRIGAKAAMPLTESPLSLRSAMCDGIACVTFRPRLFAMLAVASVAVLLGVAVLLLLYPRHADSVDSGGTPPTSGPDYALPTEPPPAAAVPTRPGVAGLVDADWVTNVSAASGIPARALAAYAGVAVAKQRAMPTCGLGWTTLAGIGKIESDHGRHGGSRIGDDGTVTPPIFGIALDGESADHIPDSDGGAIDGDAQFDRAVGPMQLIPQTWRNWHSDGNQDGVEDPQNIDDAVDATSNYLCRASGDMVSRDGWRAGVLAFNGSDAYADAVAEAANLYAKAAAGK